MREVVGTRPRGVGAVMFAAEEVADLVREALGIGEGTPPETALGQLRDRLRKILPPLDRQKNALAAFEPLLSLSRRENEASQLRTRKSSCEL